MTYPWEPELAPSRFSASANDDVLTVPRKDLDMLKIQDRMVLTGSFFRDSLVVSYEDVNNLITFELGDRAVSMEAYVLKDHIAKTYHSAWVESLWPQTTWQMFKHTHRDSWWLKWLVMRKPVVYAVDKQNVTVEVDHNYIYPEANLPYRQSLGRPRKYETYEIRGGIR